MKREAGDRCLRGPVGLLVGEPSREEGEVEQGRLAVHQRVGFRGGGQAKLAPKLVPGSGPEARGPLERAAQRAPEGGAEEAQGLRESGIPWQQGGRQGRKETGRADHGRRPPDTPLFGDQAGREGDRVCDEQVRPLGRGERRPAPSLVWVSCYIVARHSRSSTTAPTSDRPSPSGSTASSACSRSSWSWRWSPRQGAIARGDRRVLEAAIAQSWTGRPPVSRWFHRFLVVSCPGRLSQSP